MTRLKLQHDGKIALPEEMRAKLSLSPGDAVEATLEGSTIRLAAVRASASASSLDLARWIGRGRSFASPAEVDEFLASERTAWD